MDKDILFNIFLNLNTDMLFPTYAPKARMTLEFLEASPQDRTELDHQVGSLFSQDMY